MMVPSIVASPIQRYLAMARKSAIERGLASVFAYIFEAGNLIPVCVPISRDETGKLVASFATIAARKGATMAGATVLEHDVTAPVMYTFLAVSRAARKAATAVVLGREVTVNPRSRFGTELARLTGRNTAGIVLADWRKDGHDAAKEGYTLEELMVAITESYAQ